MWGDTKAHSWCITSKQCVLLLAIFFGITSKQCVLPAIFFGITGLFVTHLYWRWAPHYSIENCSNLWRNLCPFFLHVNLTMFALVRNIVSSFCLLCWDGFIFFMTLIEAGNELGTVKCKDLILCQYWKRHSFGIGYDFQILLPWVSFTSLWCQNKH